MMPRVSRPLSASALMTASLALCLPKQIARADDSEAYSFENYREDGGRITVETQTGSVDQDVGTFGHIALTGTIDAVSGATPTGVPAAVGSDQVQLTNIHTRRKAWSGNYSEQFDFINLNVGFADSREDDYVSRGWSVSTLTDFNQKNTTVRFGVAGTDDRVEVFFAPEWLPKHTDDAILGVTQLLDPNTSVTLNVEFGRDHGYLSEPHKFVAKSIEVVQGVFLQEDFGENSPAERTKGIVYAAVDHAFPAAGGSIEASYRFSSDSWGIKANTLEAAWFQHLGKHFVLSPLLRLYQQTAANFYYYDLDSTSIIPVRDPNGSGPNYSSDFRLSAMRNVEYGLKLVWNASDRLQFDVAYDRYEMWGTDGVTPKSAYPIAGIGSVGVRYSW